MQAYTVTSGSIAIRSAASASARITNVLPEGSTIYIVDEDSGWLRTSGGYYVFKTDNLALAAPKPMLRATPTQTSTPYGTWQGTTTYTPPPNTGEVVKADDVKKKKEDPQSQEAKEAETDTKVDPSDQDDSANPQTNTQNKNDRLSNKAKGCSVNITQTVKFNEKGEIVTDANGNYEMTNLPPDTDVNKLIAMSIHEHNGKLYLISQDSKGGQYVSALENSEIGKKDSKTGAMIYVKGTDFAKDAEETQDEELKKQEESILEQVKNIGSRIVTAFTNTTELTVEDSRIIHGMPYQFMPIVDPRIVKGEEISAFNAFGRKFQEKIVARAPILYMQAGLPVFLRGYSDEAKGKMLDSLVSQIENSNDSEITKLLNDQNVQYYSFEEHSNDYFKAVNSACTVLAHLLQIESVQIETLQPRDSADDSSWGQTVSDFLNPKSLGNINWAMRTSKSLGFYRGAVAFYINSENQIQETFLNGTRRSALANKINQVADTAMEAAFLMGGMGNTWNVDVAAGAAQTLYGDRNKKIGNGNDKEFMGSSLLGSIVNNISNLIAGGKMIIPEIWSDSQFQRSYNVSIKLNSPDSDTVSIFLNILVPLIHILGFVLPRSAGANMYTSPFLVRCFYKSTFHIDMGIIKSCSITKGDAGAWNHEGLPTQVTVELTIADLYDKMSQASGVDNNTLISNPAQLEYLANLAGVNIAPASFARAIELWYAVKGFRRMKEGLVGTAGDMIQNIFRTLTSIGQPVRFRY